MITRLLVANRGEIARRIFATCRAMGFQTVAVYSDADADSPHVAEADLAVRLPGSAPTDTYLRPELLIEAAARAGADALHPGYGFLAESADFAQAVLDAGLIWVGPSAKSIALMGSKVEAKALLSDAGVPVLPETGFPLLVKAAYGGGGRGMRIVRDLAELNAVLPAARREAQAAFGDGSVFYERYVEAARHIEVQVLGDVHGNLVVLGDRECSIQRRHQKIIEEAPAPSVDDALRARLYATAEAAARTVGYIGAGTVEFLLAPDGEFYFLEMNTRIQVEHTVTECVTGLDLIRLQLVVAEGRPLPVASPPPVRGHAMEVRLYAEDPTDEWRPCTGTVHRFAIPGVTTRFAVPDRYGLRLDSGVEDGSLVTQHYDPMLAKLIAWGPIRCEARRALAAALNHAELHGVTTNRDLLVRVLRHPAFVAAESDTGFLDRHPGVFEPLADEATVRASALAAALAAMAERRAHPRVLGTLPAGWRNNPSQSRTAVFDWVGGRLEVGYDRPEALSVRPDRVVLEVGGVARPFRVHRIDRTSYVDSIGGPVELTEVEPLPEPAASIDEGSLVAPVPGSVLRVAASVGDRVEAGDVLLTLEAMKLEHAVRAPVAGRVVELSALPGSQVEAGAVLAVVAPEVR